MASEKQSFLKAVKVLIDTRERKNNHITDSLDELKIPYEQRKLDYGDYSFEVAGRDFSGLCVVERKADVLELYGNVMEHRKDSQGRWIDIGERIQQELEAANRNGAQLVLLIENCGSHEELRDYVLKDYEKTMCKNLKTKDIGKPVYERLKAWQTTNRYNFRIEYCADPKQNSAAMILEEFYYWYHNYKKLIAPRR